MKKKWVGTSWKMNKTYQDAEAWSSAVLDALLNLDLHHKVQPFVIPPFPYISLVHEYFKDTHLKIGGQNMHWEQFGAYTGEVSPVMLKDIGATLVEIGHSERRAEFSETDETVNKKLISALNNGLTPLVCLGDSLQEKQWGVSIESVIRQMKIALYGVPNEKVSNTIFAYEPIWAIGENGQPATHEEAESIHKAMREALTEIYGKTIADECILLYGGSVNVQNAKILLEQSNIDGIFVGRTAWNCKGYIELLNIAKNL